MTFGNTYYNLNITRVLILEKKIRHFYFKHEFLTINYYYSQFKSHLLFDYFFFFLQLINGNAIFYTFNISINIKYIDPPQSKLFDFLNRNPKWSVILLNNPSGGPRLQKRVRNHWSEIFGAIDERDFYDQTTARLVRIELSDTFHSMIIHIRYV